MAGVDLAGLRPLNCRCNPRAKSKGRGGATGLEESFVDAPASTRLTIALRSRVTPYEELARALPAKGRIVDLGCGWGLLSLSLCAGSPDRRVTAVDHDQDRVRVAKRAAQRVPSTTRPVFICADVAAYLETVPDRSIDGIAMIDMLHYFDPAIQLSLIIHAARSLKAGGVLLARDIDADAGLRSRVNRLYERLATGIGFTKSANVRLSFRGRLEWTNLLESAGFEVHSSRSGLPMLADVLFVARKE